MKFTFGICAGNLTDVEAVKLMANIVDAVPPNQFEILFIGQQPKGQLTPYLNVGDVRWIDLDETQKPKAWITRKKNIIAQEARFENIVFMHDYFRLGEGWYDGWESFGPDFEVACNPIVTKEGFRHSDWVVDPYLLWECIPNLKNFWDVALPYNENHTPIQYISGGYWVAKKQFMLDNPLDESLLWGDAEDIEWSGRIRKKTTFRFNQHSYVSIEKPGKWAPGLIPREYLVDMCFKFGC